MKKRTIFALSVVGTLVFALLAGWPGASHFAKAESKSSWIDNSGSAVGGKAIFTDCRPQKSSEHLQPIMKKGMAPGGHKIGAIRQLQSKSAPMMAPTADMAAAPMEAEAPAPPPETPPVSEPASQPRENSIYLSNDDSMSLSSAQRVEYAIRHFLPIPTPHLRPHEFLNYYQFAGKAPDANHVFGVEAALAPGLMRDQSTLALSVKGKSLTKEERSRAVITFVLDNSGSMSSANKMTYLKKGMEQVYDELKDGDVVNIVQFNHQICVPLEGFVVGRDKKSLFKKAVDYLESWGSTNLHDGMTKGYELSEKYREEEKNNRVIMITDAMANTGVVDEQLSSTVTRFYDKRRIAFSGIGVGHDFNDSLLDRLTEKGKGAYLFLASESAVNRVFGDKFISLLEVVARDVHFKLTLPDDLKMKVFYGEESSTKKEEVQPIHYFANSAQLFLSDLEGEPKGNETIRLDVEYHDPMDNAPKTETFIWKAEEIMRNSSKTIDKARLILSLTDLIGETAPQTYPYWNCWYRPCYRHLFPPPPLPPRPGVRPPVAIDSERSRKTCEHFKKEMESLAGRLAGDPEVPYVLDLRERYCDRFQANGKKPHPSWRE